MEQILSTVWAWIYSGTHITTCGIFRKHTCVLAVFQCFLLVQGFNQVENVSTEREVLHHPFQQKCCLVVCGVLQSVDMNHSI